MPDSYEHMADCYNLRSLEATGAGAIDFLVKMAEAVVTRPPNLVFPILEETGGGTHQKQQAHEEKEKRGGKRGEGGNPHEEKQGEGGETRDAGQRELQ